MTGVIYVIIVIFVVINYQESKMKESVIANKTQELYGLWKKYQYDTNRQGPEQ